MRYLVRERLFSITDDFWITDQQGDKVFLVDGKALRLRETFELKDASGAKLAIIRKKFLTFTDAMEIEHDGAVAATVHKAVISPLFHRSVIDLDPRTLGGCLRRSGTSSTRTSSILRWRRHRAHLPGLVPAQGHLRRRSCAGPERRPHHLHCGFRPYRIHHDEEHRHRN